MSKSYLDNPVSNYPIPSQESFNNQSEPLSNPSFDPLLQSFLSLNFESQKEQIKQSPNLLNLCDQNTGNNLIHLSVQNENYPLLEFLIENGGDINSRNCLEQTPLHLAVQTENHKIINLLLEKNADANVQDINGETPMHIAAYNGDYKVIKLLLLFKANIYITNNNKMYPIDYAKETGHKKCFDVLIKLYDKNSDKYKSSTNVTKSNLNSNYHINITTSPCNDHMNNLSTITNTPFMNYVNSYNNSNSNRKHRNIHSAYFYPSHHFLSEDNSLSNNNFNKNIGNISTLSNQNLTDLSGIYHTESPHKPQLRLIPEENKNGPILQQNLNNNFDNVKVNEAPNTQRLYIKKVIGRNFSNDNFSHKINKTVSNSSVRTEAILNTNTMKPTSNKPKFEENNINNSTTTNEQGGESVMISHSNINNNFPWYVNDNGKIMCKIEENSVLESKNEIIEGKLIRIVESAKNDIICEEDEFILSPHSRSPTILLQRNNTLKSSKTKEGNELNSYAYEEIDNFVKEMGKDDSEESDNDEIIDDTDEDDDDNILQIVEPSPDSPENKQTTTNTTPNSRPGSLLPLPNSKNLKQDLFTFLKGIEMEEYTNQFFNEGFDDIKLILNQMKSGFGITDANLKEVGITKAGDRARILIRLQELSNGFDFSIPFNVVYYYNKKEFKDVKYDFHVKGMINWLKVLKMEKYIEKFYNNGYHSMELIYIQMASQNPLVEKTLEEDIGISKIGYRTRILNKIKEDAEKYIETLRKNKFEFLNRNSFHQPSCKCLIF